MNAAPRRQPLAPARSPAFVRALALGALAALAGCMSSSSLLLERVAYLAAGEEARTATDRVLDVLAPYERINELSQLPPLSNGTQPSCPGDRNLDPRLENVERFRGYCDVRRHAFATIGDPPLVAETRRLSKTVGRFDRVLAAYAVGASFTLAQSDIAVLGETLGAMAAVATPLASPAGAVADAAVDAAAFRALFDQADREAMRKLILLVGPAIDRALDDMARSAETHFAHVMAAQTNILSLDRSNQISGPPRAALIARTARIRTLLANWVALIEQQRETLGELLRAAENPRRIETRLGDLEDATAPAIRLKADTVAAMAADLGTGLPITAVALEAP